MTKTKRTARLAHTRSGLERQLARSLKVIRWQVHLLGKYPWLAYLALRRIGLEWERIKKLLIALEIAIDKWAERNLPISRQWADKHAELHRNWRQFLEAMAWAKEHNWEQDRKPSIKKALEMIEAKTRYQSIVAATRVALSPKQNRAKKPTIGLQNAKLDLSRVNFRCGDALAVLRSLPDKSVDSCVTSPPYWGAMRDYNHPDQIGLEPDVEQYIKRIVEIVRELARVLVDGGSVWMVIGDTYASSGGTRKHHSIDLNRNAISGVRHKPTMAHDYKRPRDHGMGPKNLMLIPARVALRIAHETGLTLRSEVVWEKATVRPEGVTDRPTRSHELIYLFTKNKPKTRKYFLQFRCDQRT